MQTGARAKTRGRLGRDVLARLGGAIEDYFDDVITGGVPERFRILLERVDGPQENARHGAEAQPRDKSSS
jgi:hypothetical protein